MKFGIHMPQKGGFVKNVKRAAGIGCQALQIFVGNPTGWAPPRLSEEELHERGEQVKEEGINPLLVHAAYLINLAAVNEEVFHKSVRLLQETALRASHLQASHVVMHIGSHGGQGFKEGMDVFMKTLDHVLKDWPPRVCLLLENTAGAGTSLGGTFISIGTILKALGNGVPLGVCLDTAHAWGAGYDWSTDEGFEKALTELDTHVDLKNIRAIHANDTNSPRGSHRDRHAHIGEGLIGGEGFRRILSHPWPRELPVILETPEMGSYWDAVNLGRIQFFAGMTSDLPDQSLPDPVKRPGK